MLKRVNWQRHAVYYNHFVKRDRQVHGLCLRYFVVDYLALFEYVASRLKSARWRKGCDCGEKLKSAGTTIWFSFSKKKISPLPLVCECFPAVAVRDARV